MRHAKSSWKDPELSDIERPLNKRGKKDAPYMGEMLKEKELVPQIILSSTAVRARQTAELVAAACDFTGDILYLDPFYLAEPGAYLSGLATLSNDMERVMVIGHNPGLEGLLQILSGRIEALPTGTIAYLSLPVVSWHDLQNDTEGELLELLLPRDPEEDEKKGKGKEKEKESKEKESKEKESKEKESKDKESKDKESKDKESKDKENKEKEKEKEKAKEKEKEKAREKEKEKESEKKKSGKK
jgi:phosphohistidine phosphatase